MKKYKYAFFVAASVVLFGLSAATLLFGILKTLDRAGGGEYDPRNIVVYFKSPVNPDVPLSAAVAVVDGEKITRRDYEKWIELRTRVFCMVNGMDPSKRSAKVDSYTARTKGIALADLVRRALVRQECERTGVDVPKKEIKAAQRKFMKDVRKPAMDFDAFCQALPKAEADELRSRIEEDARGEALLVQWSTNDLTRVTDAEVAARLEQTAAHNAEVERRNADSFRRASEARAEILAGAKFYEVAARRADMFKDDAREWDTVELDEFEPDDDLFKFLARAKAGDISEPLDMEDGIGIVGVLGVEPGGADGEKEPDQYVLVRCMFAAYEPVDEPTDPKALAKAMLDDRRAEARESLVKYLYGKAKVEFPYGAGLFEKHRPKAKPKAGRAKKQPGRRQTPV